MTSDCGDAGSCRRKFPLTRIVREGRWVGLAALVAFGYPLAEIDAQTVSSPPPREQVGQARLKHMGIGAAVGGLLSVGYYFLSEKGERASRCGPWSCAMPYLTVSGGLAGLFMGRELAAQRRAEMPRVGEALTFTSNEYNLPAAPTSLGLRDSLLAVATDSGAQVMSTTSRTAALRRRGAGLSDVRLVAISGGAPRLFIGTGTALWETPHTTGLLSRLLDGPVDALAAHGNVVVSASGATVRIRRGDGEQARTDTVMAPAGVTSAQYDPYSDRWWLTTDSLLLELATSGTGTPTLVQRATISGQARAVASSPAWVAVALGSEGLAIWPRETLTGSGVTSPIIMRGEPRFAFDVAFLGEDLFVAGGVDGVTRITLTPVARIIGSSRQAGYATNIVSDGTALWVADRTPGRTRVLRVTP